MEGNPKTQEDMAPHFVHEASRVAEERMTEILERAQELGVAVKTVEHEVNYIIEEVVRQLPKRYALVARKLEQEALAPADLPKAVLVDRLLGIDGIFEFEESKFAVDVTAGKSSVVINKQAKILEMEELYRSLGINHAIVLRIREEVTNDLILDFFSELEEIIFSSPDQFCVVMKYPAQKGEGHGPARVAIRRAAKSRGEQKKETMASLET